MNLKADYKLWKLIKEVKMHQRKLKPNKQKYKIRLIENVFWVKKGKRQKITSETPYMFEHQMFCPISKNLKNIQDM